VTDLEIAARYVVRELALRLNGAGRPRLKSVALAEVGLSRIRLRAAGARDGAGPRGSAIDFPVAVYRLTRLIKDRRIRYGA